MAEDPLPRRVNIVCGGRWALAKSGWKDCPAAAVPAHQVLTSDARNTGQFRWLVQWLTDASSPRCLIRNDYHPRRSLRAGEPVMLDNVEWTSEHVWDVEYFTQGSRNAQALGAAFRLINTRRGVKRYLTVCERGTDANVVIQQDPPDVLWQFFDAAGSTTQLSIDFSTCCIGAMPPCLAPSWKSDKMREGDSGTLEVFSGSMDAAVAAVAKTGDGARQYTQPSELLRIGTALAEPMEVAQSPATIQGVAEVLFGQNSSFRMLLVDGEHTKVSPLRRHPQSEHVGVTTASCVLSIPVLGKRAFSEEMRVALCREGSTTTLLIQTVETSAIGFPVGDVLTERLHLLSQHDAGPIQLRSVGTAMPGRAQQPALEGMAKVHASHFIPTFHSALQGADSAALRGASHCGKKQMPSLAASAPQQEAAEPSTSLDTCSKSQQFPVGSPHRLLWMLTILLAWICGFLVARFHL